MDDAGKSREQLLAELRDLRRQLGEGSSQALKRVRAAVWNMRRSADIREVLLAIRDELAAFGVPFRFCGVNIIEDRAGSHSLTVHHVDREGPGYRTRFSPDFSDLPFARIRRGSETVYRRDLAADDPYGEGAMRSKGVRAIIDVPFSAGTLAVSATEPDAFTDRHIDFMSSLAAILSEGFGRMRDFRDLEESHHELSMLIRTNRIAGASLDLGEVLNRIADELQQYLTCNIVEIYAVDQDRAVLELMAYREEWTEVQVEATVFALGDGLSGWIAASGKPIRIDRPATDPRSLPGTSDAVQAFLGVPVLCENQVVGVIATARFDPEAFTEAEERRLRTVADSVGTCIRNAQLYTEREKLRTEQAQGERQLYYMAESLGEGLLITGKDDEILFANTRMAKMTGYEVEEMVGQKAYMLFLPESEWPALLARNQERFAGHNGQYQLSIRRRDGSAFWVQITASPYRDGQGRIVGTVGAHIDITEHKKIEDQLHQQTEELRQAQKMEAVGQLTAGIAHNFNNMLAGVIGNVELAMQEAPQHLQSLLAGADRSARQAADIVAQLMAYSRQTFKAPYQPLALAALAREVVSICRRTFDRKIDLGLYPRDGLSAALGDAAQLTQVIMNLLLNARDAVEAADRRTPFIRLDVDEVRCTAEEIPPTFDVQPGAFVRMRVTDNGTGMDQHTLRRVFDPFFTTKPVDKGTGLGLSTVYGIVLQHGGWVACASVLGERTTFSVYLPASDLPVERDPRSPSGALPRGSETVLVIEDEEEVRMVLERALNRCGYQTLVATDGHEGLALYQAHRDDVALVLLDLSMPRMSGHEVLARLHQHDPRLKVIVLSGYTVSDSQFGDRADVLKKPIGVRALAHKVREVLDRE